MTPTTTAEWMRVADSFAALNSQDPRCKVGCVLVAADGVVSGVGTNRLATGVRVDPSRVTTLKRHYMVHAEVAAVLDAGRSARGATAYVTRYTSDACARVLATAGVAAVVTYPPTPGWDDPTYGFEHARVIMAEAGTTVTLLDAPVAPGE